MGKRTLSQNKQIRVLQSQCKIDKENLEMIVYSLTEHRTTSTKELTYEEANELIQILVKMLPTRYKMIRKIYALCKKIFQKTTQFHPNLSFDDRVNAYVRKIYHNHYLSVNESGELEQIALSENSKGKLLEKYTLKDYTDYELKLILEKIESIARKTK